MKMKKLHRDIKKRKLFKKTELFQRVLKALFLYTNNVQLMHSVRFILFNKLTVDAFRTRVHNYCVVSGRARGVYRDVKVSRIVFRNLAAKGLFFGLKKAS